MGSTGSRGSARFIVSIGSTGFIGSAGSTRSTRPIQDLYHKRMSALFKGYRTTGIPIRGFPIGFSGFQTSLILSLVFRILKQDWGEIWDCNNY